MRIIIMMDLPMVYVMCLLCGHLGGTDLSGYVFVLWRPGMHRSVWLRCRVHTRGWVRVTVVRLSVGLVVATFACKMSPNSSLNFLCRTYVVIVMFVMGCHTHACC
jgi:hypothetical protein